MTLAAIQRGLIYPTADYAVVFTSATLDAATEKLSCVGRIYWNGRPAGAKTLSTGTIQFRTGTCTFANGSTTLDIGIQGVSTSGPIGQPDGSYSVKTTLTGGAGITTAAWNTATMNSGTVNLTHGDLCAVVFDMTARGGADSVIIQTAVLGGNPSSLSTGGGSGFPVTNAFVAGAWQSTITLGAGNSPNVIIVSDDGTVGWFDFTVPQSVIVTGETFATGTNPNERGMIFQVPWDCKIDALWLGGGADGATGDFTLKLYSDPTGTPTLLTSVAVLVEQSGILGAKFHVQLLATEISLSKNTDYCVTVLATGAGNTRLNGVLLGDTAHRAAIPGGTTLKKATRNGSAGAFTAESPAITIYGVGVRISQLHDGAGSGTTAHVIGG